MPDISMCANGAKCEKRARCWRFTAQPSYRQSYADFYTPGGECVNFYGNEGRGPNEKHGEL